MKLRKNRVQRRHNFYVKHLKYTENKLRAMNSEELLLYYIDAIYNSDKLFLFRKWFTGYVLMELATRYRTDVVIIRKAIQEAYENRKLDYTTNKFEYKLDIIKARK